MAPGDHTAVLLKLLGSLHMGNLVTVGALSAQTPFRGGKQSGFGRDLSLHSLEKYTASKAIWIKYKA